eukprot:TRINITY_DN15379_c0_g1_i3.p1 TRINITY_DN15379_c0_g1~~TRINITY_DN15379_c0_g1_i3.p1  ORF type:complete len:206 (+),score=22.48 TRINITY_DN15379_c0_g1_i3:92-709(+)
MVVLLVREQSVGLFDENFWKMKGHIVRKTGIKPDILITSPYGVSTALIYLDQTSLIDQNFFQRLNEVINNFEQSCLTTWAANCQDPKILELTARYFGRLVVLFIPCNMSVSAYISNMAEASNDPEFTADIISQEKLSLVQNPDSVMQAMLQWKELKFSQELVQALVQSGSIAEISKFTPEQLAQKLGCSSNVANQIVNFFHQRHF